MFGPTVRMTRNHQAWLRAVIFVGLYLMLLLSFTQCALVLYLYGTGQVDGLLTPSLIIALIAVRIYLMLVAKKKEEKDQVY